MKEIRNISIFGSGLMGKGIAILFAKHGFNIKIYTRNIKNEKKNREDIEQSLMIMKEMDILGKLSPKAILSKISFSDSFEKTATYADFVIESIVENIKIKKEYFGKLDLLCKPDVILATNTSAISITQIGEDCTHKERIVGTHFWNPPQIIPLVEIVKTEYVSDLVVEKTLGLMLSVGKKPIIVKKDIPGFIANRIQNALNREAFAIVNDGIADAKDVDDSIKYGFGMRLPFQGPFEKADMIGLDIPYSVQTYLFPYLNNSEEPSELLKNKVEANELGFKTGSGFFEWTEEKKADTSEDFLTKTISVAKLMGVL